MKFQTSVAGTVSGIRFYKSSQDTGVHTGELWSSTGTMLATVTFTNETASGWQSVTFSNPVTLTPGATYVASYHTNVGHYSNTTNYFTRNVTSGPLTAPASGNGVYAYGSNSLFPTNTFPGDELLGRRHVQSVHRQPAAGGRERRRAGRRRETRRLRSRLRP